ncbi:PREDICTED: 4-coumarate--CoA ligase 1-like [Nicrophorus vespilloides]|uniref:4-coumarate--CoA ligase 1-like n=1 Tax=Nicrophorus vespilloides TaxID=110193 RepID=A0ABM1M412_NICVS|nr:PREDICTED: 4-coumarate--CoA ligase 1-like [Nicrophorus vespilloides]
MNNDACNIVLRKGNYISGPSIDYKAIEGGLGKFMFDQSKKFPNKICQIFAETGDYDTFSTFIDKSVKVAIEMRKRGVTKGDMLVHCTPNTLDSAVAYTAGIFLGAISSSLDPTLPVRDCVHLVNLIEPKMVFLHENSVELMENTLSSLEGTSKPSVIVFGNSEKYDTFKEFLNDSEDAENFKPIDVTDCNETILILFSSGTTGLPKGICLSHNSLYTSAMNYDCYINDTRVMIHFTTFYWISALMIFFLQFKRGDTRILSTGFEAETGLRYIEHYKITHAFMANSYMHKIISYKFLHEYDLTSLTNLGLGGGPIGKELMMIFRKLLPGCYCNSIYGMTEIGGCISFYCPQESELSNQNPDSCGRPVKGITIKVCDTETGKLLTANKSGEIRVKYPHILNGYHKQDHSDIFDEEGFIKTGDIGHYDETCSLYVYDRLKDMFKYQSWHIVPASVENVIREHPEVAEVVVFGIPHEIDGDHPAAAITLIKDAKVTAPELDEFVTERVHERQRLRAGIFIVDHIPKTPTGKMLRRKIREQILEKIKK